MDVTNYKEQRKYFEDGCLCILTGRMYKQHAVNLDETTVHYYMDTCVCSRHPEGKLNKNYDEEAENAMRAIWEGGK